MLATRLILLITLILPSFLLLQCGTSIFDFNTKPTTEAEILEATKQILDSSDPDYDQAITNLDELWDLNNLSIYKQLKAFAILGSGGYDIFQIMTKMIDTTTSSSSSNNSNSSTTSLLLDDNTENTFTLMESATSSSDSSSSSSSSGFFMSIQNILPQPTDANRAILKKGSDTLEKIPSDEQTTSVTFQKTLISSLIVVQTLRSLTSNFDLSNFDPSNVTAEKMSDALTSINDVLKNTTGEDNVFSEGIQMVSDNIDKGGCSYTDYTTQEAKTAAKNGVIEPCELNACSVTVVSSTGGCFQ